MDHDPYRPPSAPQPLPPPLHPSAASPERPPVITIFSIIHLVLSLFGLFGTASILLQPVMMKYLSTGSEDLRKQMNMQASYQWWLYVCAGASVVLTVIIVTAAVKMLKGRPDGLGWSNAYAWTSIAWKVVGIIVNVMVVAPVVRASARELSNPMISGLMTSTPYYIFIGLVTMIYPFLSLILLNRPTVREWFARQGPR